MMGHHRQRIPAVTHQMKSAEGQVVRTQAGTVKKVPRASASESGLLSVWSWFGDLPSSKEGEYIGCCHIISYCW